MCCRKLIEKPPVRLLCIGLLLKSWIFRLYFGPKNFAKRQIAYNFGNFVDLYKHTVCVLLIKTDSNSNLKTKNSTHRNSHLLHGVSLPQRNRIWLFNRVKIDCNAKRYADFIRSSVTFTN